MPIFALSESAPQKGGRVNRTTPVPVYVIDRERVALGFYLTFGNMLELPYQLTTAICVSYVSSPECGARIPV